MTFHLVSLALFVVALPLPLLLGFWLANVLRMRDYGWRLALILCSIGMGGVFLYSLPLRLGVDLKGGVILVYEVDQNALAAGEESSGASAAIDWSRLMQALTNRINPSGTKEIVVRRYGEWQVEIIIPDVETIEVENIKKLISTAGALEFHIVANREKHEFVIRLAEEQSEDPLRRRSKYVKDGNKMVGFWARVGREQQAGEGGIHAFKLSVARDIIRDASTGQILQLPGTVNFDQPLALAKWVQEQGIKELDVLMFVDEDYKVTGEHLGMVSRSFDATTRPCVRFNMKGQGAGLMGGLTGTNTPDKQRQMYNHLGIVLDGTLLSAPRVMDTITDRGEITGSFTQDEVDFLVSILQAGSLPAALKKVPISENQIGAIVGEDTIRSGKIAAGVALASTLLFMLVWYRFSGLVACAALVLNLVLTLAAMKLVQAPLTLPGLAGLVLSMGMAVDANVLIYERFREELEKGAALRMAIRNGFDRAMVTIVDSNLTTLITGLVMYVIGTDQIRGFAVTLSLGLVISMYTAVFCARVVFEIFERKRLISTLSMMKLFGKTSIDFMSARFIFVGFSLLLTIGGLIATVARGKQIFDIDFLGGTSVTMILEKPEEEREIRTKLDEKFAALRVNGSAVQYSVNRVDVAGRPDRTVWKIDSSLDEVERLQTVLAETFTVAHHSMEFGELQEKRETVKVPAETPAEKTAPAVEPKAAVSENVKPAEKSASPPVAAPAKNEKEPPAEKPVVAPAPAPAEEAKQPPAEMPVVAPGEEEAPPAQSKPAEAAPAKPEASETKPTDTPPPAADSKPAEPAEPTEKPAAGDAKETAEPKEPEGKPSGGARSAPPSDTLLALADGGEWRLALADDPAAAPAAKPADESATKTVTDEPATPAPAENADAKTPAGAPAKDEPATGRGETKPAEKTSERVLTTATLKFDYATNGRTLEAEIMNAAEVAKVPLTEEDIMIATPPTNPDWTIDDAVGYAQWTVTLAKDRPSAEKILQQVKARMAKTPVWPSSSKIGGKVAGDTRTLAIVALIASWIGIIIYIWIRFQHVVFGLAAVIALIHDVLVALGAVAISYWLAGFLGFLEIQEFKISLTVVVAFLTIIGYSVNDTIVVFDRVREVRGKNPKLTVDMVNLSINETLSRTMLTGLTTIVNTLILYLIGGEGVHAFAYTLFVGFVIGTYSSVFVASPFVLWLFGRKVTAKAPGAP